MESTQKIDLIDRLLPPDSAYCNHTTKKLPVNISVITFTPLVNMDSSNDPGKDAGTASEKLRDYISKNGVKNINEFIGNELKAWEEVEVNIAVTGDSGAGKSSYINAIRG